MRAAGWILVVALSACNRDAPPPPQETHATAGQVDHAAHGDGGAGTLPRGYSSVTVASEHAAGMQLATATVDEVALAKTVRTTGVVALDETRTAHVHAKVRGWIEGITANFVGRKVNAGESLCSIYSQEVYAGEIEFLSIVDRVTTTPTSSGELAGAEQRASVQLVDAARKRLLLWDVPKHEIERLERTREARRTFPLLAPRAGTIVAKAAVDGLFMDPSVELYTLSDLSRVWVLADVYEADVASLRIGDSARLTIEGQKEPVAATLAFLSPTIDEATRTLKARFELSNRDGSIRPGAFVAVELAPLATTGLAIPESAVIRTGPRAIVFVAEDEHATRLSPREVRLGPLVGNTYRVEGGVEKGARVAVGAQFLLDSESRLRATSAAGGGHAH